MNDLKRTIGFVAIGRNEGERFKQCLASLKGAGERIVYVDSGSVDESVPYAEEHGALVVSLEEANGFTAARARNAGFRALEARWPDTDYVMFIDGDCALIDGFIETAAATLSHDETIGVVTGRCRERLPDASIYNRLCEIEWRGPAGDINACGGIFMVRAYAFRGVEGFRDNIIAAEDDDFCIRIRANGARIVRIDRDMCFHDADMHEFGQWWRRMVRAGCAFAQLGDLHRDYFRAERRRAWGWGLALPAAALVGAPLSNGLSFLLLGLYPASFLRTRQGLIRRGEAPRHASLGAAFLTLAKFPNLIGILKHRWRMLTGAKVEIVEYK